MPHTIDSATTARETIAAEVRAAMGRRGTTTEQLATVIGVTGRTMRLRLSSVSPFRGEELVLIAAHLGVDAGQFLTCRT